MSGFYKQYGKRILDIVVAGGLIICCSGIFVIIALLILFFMGRPIFFVQDRPGKDSKIFHLVKFRTMKNLKAGENGLTLHSDEERLTLVGRILRKLSLDELPELFNIFKGEMSFVGPRPLLPEYLPYYSKEELNRHQVRPGLTGLAQVNGRNAVKWDKRLAYDCTYVKNLSLAYDIKIFIKTFQVVLSTKDVNQGEKSETYLNEERAKMIEGKFVLDEERMHE
ncbi:MAG: sugar transferase [Enterococcus sp.]